MELSAVPSFTTVPAGRDARGQVNEQMGAKTAKSPTRGRSTGRGQPNTPNAAEPTFKFGHVIAEAARQPLSAVTAAAAAPRPLEHRLSRLRQYRPHWAATGRYDSSGDRMTWTPGAAAKVDTCPDSNEHLISIDETALILERDGDRRMTWR
jgi:hypothetical protein